MAKLKLGPIADDKPVKVTLELPASLHRDLVFFQRVPSQSWNCISAFSLFEM